MNRITLALLTITVFAFQACDTRAQVSEFRLDNGLRVVVNEVPEAKDVGVEAIYEVGFRSWKLNRHDSN